jgi:hypothetical protein
LIDQARATKLRAAKSEKKHWLRNSGGLQINTY